MKGFQGRLIVTLATALFAASIGHSAYACEGVFDLGCNIGKLVGKVTHDTGGTIEKGAHDTTATIGKATHDTGLAIDKLARDTGRPFDMSVQDDRQLVPVRAFLRSADIPPAEFGAYGVMALRAKPTSVTRERLKMACASFVAYLARQTDVPKSILLSDQMLTI